MNHRFSHDFGRLVSFFHLPDCACRGGMQRQPDPIPEPKLHPDSYPYSHPFGNPHQRPHCNHSPHGNPAPDTYNHTNAKAITHKAPDSNQGFGNLDTFIDQSEGHQQPDQAP